MSHALFTATPPEKIDRDVVYSGLDGILGRGLPSGEHVVSTWKRALARFSGACETPVSGRPKASLICSLAFDAVPSRFYLDQLGRSEKSAQSIYTHLGCDKSVND